MAERTGIVVAGGSGRMGRMLIELVEESGAADLAGVLEAPGHPWVGQDLGTALGAAPRGVTVGDDPEAALAGADALLDFTAPAASVAFAPQAAAAGAVHVIGTTGLAEADTAAIDAAGGVVVRAGNMSLGVNLLAQLARRVAAALDADFDIEVVEAHHRHKRDAPSGTALMLGEAAAAGRGVALADVADRGRDGLTGARGRGAIGFAAIRGGDIVGEHQVLFAGTGERVTLGHVATDRAVFARGALKAALWGQGQGQRPGTYDMIDVLGLR